MNYDRKHCGSIVVVAVLVLLALSVGSVAAQEHATTTATPADGTDHASGGNQGSPQESESGHDDGHDHSESGLLGGWLTAIGGLFVAGTIVSVPLFRRFGTEELTRLDSPVRLLGTLLTLFTAAVHLYLFLQNGAVVMLLAALGFLGGIGLFATGLERRYLYVAGIAYTALQFALWIAAGAPHLVSFGVLDKVAQLLLIGVLAHLFRTER